MLWRVCALVLLAVSLQAGQSLRMNGARGTFTSPNVANGQDSYAVFQLHRTVAGNFSATATWRVILADNGLGLKVERDTGNRLVLSTSRDSTEGGSPCYLSGLNTRSNILGVIHRRASEMMIYGEMWNVDGTGYATCSRVITSLNSWSFSGGVIGDSNWSEDNEALGFVRTYLGTKPLGSKPPTTAGGTGARTWWKLDDDTGADSSGNGRTLTMSGTRVYVATPGQDTVAVLVEVPNYEAWMGSDLSGILRAERAKAGDTPLAIPANAFDLSKSYVMGDATDVPTCALAFVSGPSTPTVGNASTCTPTVSNLVFGPYEFTATIEGIAQTIKVGAVAYDDNDVVIYPHAALYSLLGRTKVFGKGTYEYRDARHLAGFNWVVGHYDGFGGTKRWEALQPERMAVQPTGTAYLSTANPYRIYGIDTNFCTVVCPGGASSCTDLNTKTSSGVFMTALKPNADPNIPPQMYPRQLQDCISNTEVSLTQAIDNPIYNVASPGVTWTVFFNDTSGQDLGDWRGSGNTDKNDQYYDNGLGHYALYFRSGWWKARDAGRFIADNYWRYPLIWGGGTSVVPRFYALFSAMVRATGDYDVSMPYAGDRWAGYKLFSDNCFTSRFLSSRPRVSDVREGAYCLWYTALMAELDPNVARANTLKDRLVSAWSDSAIQGTKQSSGAWPSYALHTSGNNVAVGTVFKVTQGSDVVVWQAGPQFAANMCGTSAMEAGTVTLNTRTTITGSGGADFTGQGGKTIILRGTMDGVPRSMVSEIATSPAPSTTATLVYPWRGDMAPISKYRVFSSAPFDRNSAEGPWYLQFFPTTITGTYPDYPPADDDNWYWCTWDSATQITLDKPFTHETAISGQYRKMFVYFSNTTSAPFQESLMSQALFASARALRTYNPTVAAEYNAAGLQTLTYLRSIRNPNTGGLPYQVGGTNCDKIDQFYPSKDCDSNATGNRDFAVESIGAWADGYLVSNGNTTVKANGDLFAADLFGVTGYASPDPGNGVGMPGIQDFAYNGYKLYGQTWGAGRSYAWDGARLAQAAARAFGRSISGRFNFSGRVQ